MIETLILLGCLYLSIRVTDYIEKQKQNNKAARTIPLKTLYKTVVAIPFGVMKKINLRLVLGTERKKILKDITNTISVKL